MFPCIFTENFQTRLQIGLAILTLTNSFHPSLFAVFFFFLQFQLVQFIFLSADAGFFGLPLHCLLISTKLICKSISHKEYACTCAYVSIHLELDLLGIFLSIVMVFQDFLKCLLFFLHFFLHFYREIPAQIGLIVAFISSFHLSLFVAFVFFSVLINPFFDFVSVHASFLWSLSSFTLLAAIL